MYEHKYILKTPHVKISEATLLGSILHLALEDFYLMKRSSLLESFESLDEECLNGIGLGEIKNPTRLWNLLKEFSERSQELHFRASEACTVNPIRKSNGGVASRPAQTLSWQTAFSELGLEKLEEEIDMECLLGFSCMPQSISLANVFSKARYIAANYQPPSEIAEVLHVEYQITATTPPKFPQSELVGYIDLVARDVDGNLMIIDHKSWSEQITETFVGHNTQLNLYAFGFHQMTGEYPAFLAVNELKSNRFVRAPFNERVMEGLLERFFALIPLTQQTVFPGHSPDTQYSPCLNQFNKPCPFLQHCWPDAV